MVSEALDFRFLLLENYKKLKLNEQELATILMIDHLISQGNPLVTQDLLSLKMSMDVKSIDNILAMLLTKGYIAFVTEGGKTITTLEPLKKILFREFQFSMTREANDKSEKQTNEQLENIYQAFDKLLGRQLSPVEISKIREWVEHGYSDEMIINALKEALTKGKKSLRSVDKILLSWEQRDDIEKDGVTTRSEEWDRNLEETIRIAKTPWLDDDDDK